jgi:phytanoyl-CoA dioxygenase PhyH
MMSRSVPVLETLAKLGRLKRVAERLTARAQFALQRKKRLTPLSAEQVRQYHRDGYLLVSGLIPVDLARRAAAGMYQALRASPEAPETWSRLGPPPYQLREERFIATYTDEMLAAAAQLAGEDVATFLRPTRVLTINVVPVSKDWRAHEPHLDRVIPESRFRTFPRSFRVGALTYLTDVQSHGAGTIVWPGSHLKVEALARSDIKKYRFLAALYRDLDKIELGPALELTPSAGDVMFHDHLFVHAGSDNVGDKPRIAINHKW